MTEQQQDRFDRYIKDLETIVNMESASEDLDGVANVAAFLAPRFEALGLEVEVTREGERGVPCLKARTKSKNGRYDFMFLGHMDTVFPSGEATKRPFSIEGDRCMGPGTGDMKGGLMVALNVVEVLKEEGVLDDIAIHVAFNGDEEVGSEDSRPMIEEVAKKCDRVFVFEPCRPGFRHVLRRKGGGWLNIVAHGTASHAGADPEKGVNAVVEIAHQITRINELNNSGDGTTAQCTIVRGGEKTNIIPDRADVTVDVRVETMASMKKASDFFDALPDNTVVPGAKIEVNGHIDRPPMEPTEVTEELWKVLNAEGLKIGVESEYIATGGCSDGNYTAAVGCPTIDGMGPVGANSHRVDEYVELSSIIPAITMIAETCKKVVL